MPKDKALAEENFLTAGAKKLGLSLNAVASQKLLAYLDLLQNWNDAINLTAKTSNDHAICAHLLDSIAATPHINGQKVLDVGSGAGLPGIPLSIMLPEVQFYLLESRLKRVVFLRHAKKMLQLDNIFIEHSRLEAYHPKHGFDTILSRAFAPVERFAKQVAPLVQHDTQLLCFLGRINTQELSLPDGWELKEIEPLSIPGLVGQRHLVSLIPSGVPINQRR